MLMKIKKAQSITEYAILFSLVVAAAVGVQTYVKRGLQARVHDAVGYYANETAELGTTVQWEPTSGTKTTTKQVSTREFIEDYENEENPFSYDETSEVEFKSTETK